MSAYGEGSAHHSQDQPPPADDEEFDPSCAVYRSLAHQVDGGENPVYRSMSGAPDFPDYSYAGGGSSPFDGAATTTFEQEQPVYRSLSYMEQPALQSVSAQSAALAKPTLGGGGGAGMAMPAMRGMADVGAPLGLPSAVTSFPSKAFSASVPTVVVAASAAADPTEGAAPFPLPKLPYALEHTHVFLSRPAGKNVVTEVARILADCGVDSEFKAGKCKWKAVAYEQGASLDFRVRLYENPEQAIILEAQRRRGDLLHFKRLYLAVISALAEAGLAKDIAGRAPLMRVALPTQTPLSPAEMTDAMAPLFGMLKGPYVEAQTEAAAKLVAFSTSAERSCAYVHELGSIVPLLGANNIDVRRCAVSMVANLIEVERGCQEQVVELGALRMLMPLAAPAARGVDRETQRESCRLLACLCEKYAPQVQAVASDAVQQLLHDCDKIADSRLQGHVMRARDILQRQKQEM